LGQHSGGIFAGRGRYSRVSGQSLKPLNIEDCHGMLFDIGDSLFA
jgi:hypothetical protein